MSQVSMAIRNAIVIERKIKRFTELYDKNVKKGIGSYLTVTRAKASEYIIPNTTGTLNPWKARIQQPNTPNKLTSRTGKLKLMLGHKADVYQPEKNWKGTRKLLTDHSMALKGTVRVNLNSNVENRYRGVYRVDISGHGRLYSRYGGMPRETVKTLGKRFNWERGIRGGKRPFMKPIIDRNKSDFERYVGNRVSVAFKFFNRDTK